ncbi:hypothetical protein KY330_03745 [Candidatus Woesearchaeota archaeon]|nr:hypothetical protein [Candidatus Woesearchaeota archaeon]
MRFKIGVLLIIANFFMTISAAFVLAYGSYGAFQLSSLIYGASWVVLGIGVFLAGKKGYRYSKKIMQRWYSW